MINENDTRVIVEISQDQTETKMGFTVSITMDQKIVYMHDKSQANFDVLAESIRGLAESLVRLRDEQDET